MNSKAELGTQKLALVSSCTLMLFCVSDIVTHMGICSSTDPRTINRIVVGEYVTASQAQRKWFTKVISKATKGAYQLGAVSAFLLEIPRVLRPVSNFALLRTRPTSYARPTS